jgi:hypothetical protein
VADPFLLRVLGYKGIYRSQIVTHIDTEIMNRESSGSIPDIRAIGFGDWGQKHDTVQKMHTNVTQREYH